MKAGEPNFVFRTLPGTKPVTRMELGGALGTVRDKIFVSTGSEVKGFTKKGKLFLQFETNLAEAIETMYISGSNLMVCGNYVYNHYNDCRVEFLNFYTFDIFGINERSLEKCPNFKHRQLVYMPG